MSGYADDTALYLRDNNELPVALGIMDSFIKVSGLKINVARSLCVPLGKKADWTQRQSKASRSYNSGQHAAI